MHGMLVLKTTDFLDMASDAQNLAKVLHHVSLHAQTSIWVLLSMPVSIRQEQVHA